MRWAIALALEAEGRTSPNPMVGCVVVKNNRIVGEGYHRRAGTAHAEVHALREAGRRARGADLYVTLEPCCYHGRTPPCVPAIVESGIRRVVVGTRDPNPRIDGRGIRLLKNAGVRVIEGVLEESCRALNESYNAFIVRGTPFVTAKVALSLDGKIATAAGEARWITNEECRRYVHLLRGGVDAVCVGGGTVRADDPRLTVRLKVWHGIHPRAVVVDEELKIPRNARLFRRRPGQLIAVTTERAPRAMRAFLERRGHRVIVCPAGSDGRVPLRRMLRELGKAGISSLLVEGGGKLFADFFRKKLVDRVVACIAPKFIGGAGRDFLPGVSIARIGKAIALRDVQVKTFGDNVVIEGKMRRSC